MADDEEQQQQPEQPGEAPLVRQKLMTAEDVYVYKIPHLKTAGGHRAEDWNLSTPLKTCNLLVERRGDCLVLEFTTAEGGQLFCQSQLDLTAAGHKTAEQWLEQVVDSSRYFVVKIQQQQQGAAGGGGGGGREAVIGFGFRDRDQATDLRESVQHYERSVRREREASATGAISFSVPKMGKEDKIHVNRGGKSTITKKDGSGKAGAIPLLKKKPPSSPERVDREVVSAKAVEKMTFQMADIDLDADNKADRDGSDDDDNSSGGAVYEGDEEQWATEFAMK